MDADSLRPMTDDELVEVTRKVVHLVTREHALSGNQLFELASHLQRVATHRIIEERLRASKQGLRTGD